METTYGTFDFGEGDFFYLLPFDSWVTESCSAVFAKFKVSDKVRKQVSWNVFMGNPFYKIDKSFLSMITFFEFTCKPECV